MTYRQFGLTLTTALALTAFAAQAQDQKPNVPFEQADADRSGGLDADELRMVLYKSFDTDGSATIEEMEYANGDPMFKEVGIATFDANSDKSVDEDEFKQGYEGTAAFDKADTNHDATISSDEYAKMFTGY